MKTITEVVEWKSTKWAVAFWCLTCLAVASFVWSGALYKSSAEPIDATRVMTNQQIVGKCRDVADHCIGGFVIWGDASPIWRISACEPSCGTAEVRLSELGSEPKYTLDQIDIVLRSDSRWDYVSERFKDQYIRPFNPYSER